MCCHVISAEDQEADFRTSSDRLNHGVHWVGAGHAIIKEHNVSAELLHLIDELVGAMQITDGLEVLLLVDEITNQSHGVGMIIDAKDSSFLAPIMSDFVQKNTYPPHPRFYEGEAWVVGNYSGGQLHRW